MVQSVFFLSVDPEIYQRSEPRRLRATNAPFTIGYVGRLVENKGAGFRL